ncbi:hypothetical protein ACI77O_13480 [Pseudomonas tritici]|uniref:hypothetical protein n=1 Tax=Pseudomonas tritici TaxID=2745518 RepID=UPI00387ACAE4
MFDAKAESEKLRANSKAIRKKHLKRSALDKFKAELLALNLHGSTLTELQAWLATKKLKVERSTVQRWLKKNVLAPTASLHAIPCQMLGPEYSAEQIELIISRQKSANALVTMVVWYTGIRPGELFTLTKFDKNIFEVEVGKGHQRLIDIPPELVAHLDSYKLPRPKDHYDRGCYYRLNYALPGGSAWAKSFNEACRSALGWSDGIKRLRNTYLNKRLSELQLLHSLDEAIAMLKYELGD